MFTPQKINYNHYRAALLALREQAWQTNDRTLTEKIFTDGYEDAFDQTAYHWGVFDGERLVAASRLSVHKDIREIPNSDLLPTNAPELAGPIGSLNRLVVHLAYRKRGLSDVLDHCRMERAMSLGCRTVVSTTHHGNRGQKLLSMGFTVLCNVTPPRLTVNFLPLFATD
jgi:hypothetical protein